MKILVLLSGGLDSAVVLASLLRDEHECSAVGFDYGQKHLIELEYAEQIAAYYRVPFRRICLPKMPLVNDVVFAGRNLVLAAHAIAIAQAEDFEAIAVGCNESDWERFPDCRPEFWRKIQDAAHFYDIEVLMPMLYCWKADVVKLAKELNVPATWSCYSPQDNEPCGECLACKTRKDAECSMQA